MDVLNIKTEYNPEITCIACLRQHYTSIPEDPDLLFIYSKLVDLGSLQNNQNALKFCLSCTTLLKTVLEFTLRCRISKKLFEEHLQDAKSSKVSPKHDYSDFDNIQSYQAPSSPLADEIEAESIEPEPNNLLVPLKKGLRRWTKLVETNKSKHKKKKKKPISNDTTRLNIKNLQDYLLGQTTYCSLCCKNFPSYLFPDHVIAQHATQESDGHKCQCCSTYIQGGTNKFVKHFMDHIIFDGAKKCLQCYKEFYTFREMEDHIKEHTNLADKFRIPHYVCHHCGKEIRDKNRLQCHIINKHMTTGMLCKFRTCGMYFLHEDQLKRHETSHGKRIEVTGEVPSMKCNVCNLRVPKKNKEDFCEHMKERIKKWRTQKKSCCDHCGKIYLTKPELRRHIEYVHEGVTFECDLCNRKLAGKVNLVKHMKSVHGVGYAGRVLCDICGKSFKTRASRKSHIKMVHQKIKKAECSDCGLLFQTKASLQKHQHTHTNTRPFNCHLCQTGYYCTEYLTGHYKRSHNMELTRDELYQVMIRKK